MYYHLVVRQSSSTRNMVFRARGDAAFHYRTILRVVFRQLPGGHHVRQSEKPCRLKGFSVLFNINSSNSYVRFVSTSRHSFSFLYPRDYFSNKRSLFFAFFAGKSFQYITRKTKHRVFQLDLPQNALLSYKNGICTFMICGILIKQYSIYQLLCFCGHKPYKSHKFIEFSV